MPSPTSSSKENTSGSSGSFRLFPPSPPLCTTYLAMLTRPLLGKDSASIRKELVQKRQEIKKLDDLLKSKADAASEQAMTLGTRERELKERIQRFHARNVEQQAELRKAASQPRAAGSWGSSGTGSPGIVPQTPRRGLGGTEFGGMLTTQEEAVQGEHDALREMKEVEERRKAVLRELAEEKKGIQEEIRKLELEREELRGQLGSS